MLVEVAGLNKTFRSGRSLSGKYRHELHAVKDVDLSLEDEETLVIIGESGAGKSTTGRLINRLVEPDSGAIRILGTDVRSLSYREMQRFRVNLQMIFQDPYSSLPPRMTIQDAVSEPLLIHADLSKAERRRRAGELLERVGVDSSYLGARPRELSGGQLQRAVIARAISIKPKLIICDEPLSALDVSMKAQVLNLLLELKRDYGIAYIFITHDLSVVRIIGDNAIVMRNGEVVERGTATQIVEHPSHPYARDLLAAVPSLVPKALRTAPAVDSPR